MPRSGFSFSATNEHLKQFFASNPFHGNLGQEHQEKSSNLAAMDSKGSCPGMKLEKNAGLIMGTNNSSIVSKRSVERLYHPKPHFFQYFVRKPQRRSPTINRGYWLRMQAVDSVVKEFLQRPSEKQKVVINLGCG
jgi:Leucine carboxyl methyltransferase